MGVVKVTSRTPVYVSNRYAFSSTGDVYALTGVIVGVGYDNNVVVDPGTSIVLGEYSRPYQGEDDDRPGPPHFSLKKGRPASMIPDWISMSNYLGGELLSGPVWRQVVWVLSQSNGA